MSFSAQHAPHPCGRPYKALLQGIIIVVWQFILVQPPLCATNVAACARLGHILGDVFALEQRHKRRCFTSIRILQWK